MASNSSVVDKIFGGLESIESSLQSLENILEEDKREQDQTDREIDSIGGLIDQLSQGFSEKTLKNAVRQAKDVDSKLQEELDRLEKTTEAHENQLSQIKSIESGIFDEEKYVKNELDDAMAHIQHLQTDLEEEELAQTIEELNDALERLNQIAEQLLAASKVFGDLIKQEQEEISLESHLEEEVSSFHGEVKSLHEFVVEAKEGGRDDLASHEERVENMLGSIEEETRSEHEEIAEELELGQNDLKNLEKEIKRFKQEFKELYQEIEALEENSPNSGQFSQYESRIRALEENSQKVRDKIEEAYQNIQEDESLFSNIISFFN